ncbi:SDR family oxidoreductase [Parasedimentitalea denitrificans]|nr:SDR family NAD(P)-dependent oxidoreductase [Sedimentitalea sp. CY04]
MWLEGKHILLTGATRGIGRALATQLIKDGATVIAVARNTEALTALAWELGPQLQPYTCDLQNVQDREELIEKLTSAPQPLDGVINNAGIQIEADYMVAGRNDLAKNIAAEIDINLVAPLHLCASLAIHLAQRPEGFIVNVTSGLVLFPKQNAPIYCATKAGLRSFTTALRYQAEQLAPNMLVCECIMSLVDTDMTQGRGSGKITPDKAAQQLLQGLRRGSDEIWIGKTRALRWINRLSPKLAAKILHG